MPYFQQEATMATATDLDMSSLTQPYVSISPTLSLSKDGDSDCDAYSLSSSVITSVEGGDTSPSSFQDNSSAEYWASLLRQSYTTLHNGGSLDAECLKAPRRRHAGTLRLGEGRGNCFHVLCCLMPHHGPF